MCMFIMLPLCSVLLLILVFACFPPPCEYLGRRDGSTLVQEQCCRQGQRHVFPTAHGLVYARCGIRHHVRLLESNACGVWVLILRSSASRYTSAAMFNFGYDVRPIQFFEPVPSSDILRLASLVVSRPWLVSDEAPLALGRVLTKRSFQEEIRKVRRRRILRYTIVSFFYNELDTIPGKTLGTSPRGLSVAIATNAIVLGNLGRCSVG